MDQQQTSQKHVVIIGAGPAGLTAAYELAKLNQRPLVLEERDKVGGLSCTENFQGFHFDMGGHRFFTKVNEVKQFWHEILGGEFLRRPRLSRIYYRRKFFYYPLKPLNALLGLGFWDSTLIVFSYIKWQFFPYQKEDTFEEWVTNRFGKRLFKTFFETYTEKVWGIPCSELKAEWAAQRIKNLSLKTALLAMFFKPKQTIKTLIEEFEYPRLGPGMMWKAVKEAVDQRNGRVELESKVIQINRTGRRIHSVMIARNGHHETVEGSDFISSMPVTDFVKKLSPSAPAEVVTAAKQLKYRDFLTVCLIVNRPDLFPDNWIYIHDPSVKVGRIQNFKNWSPDMVPDKNKTSLGLEYFCFEGDGMWTMSDAALIALAKKELDTLGMCKPEDVFDGVVVRQQKAYPVYDDVYQQRVSVIREYLSR